MTETGPAKQCHSLFSGVSISFESPPFSSASPQAAIGRIKWRRVVFDESHNGEGQWGAVGVGMVMTWALTHFLDQFTDHPYSLFCHSLTPTPSHTPPLPSPPVKTPSTAQSRICALLEADRRWCCSGTPVNTDIRDLLGQFAALRMTPLDNPAAFEALIRGPFAGTGR